VARLDERLRAELDRLSPPADPTGVVDRILRRGARRYALHRLGIVALTVVVLAGSAGGVVALSRVFGPPERGATDVSGVSNGSLAIALASDPVTPGMQRIALLDPSGGEPRFLTAGAAVETSLTWSPDGRRLVFWRGGPDVDAGVWVMNADGGDAHLLYGTTASIWAIKWSPDGSRIAFINVEVPSGTATELDLSDDLYLMSAEGTDVTPVITDGQVTDLDWSPDGSQLVIERQFGRGQERTERDLAIVYADGSGERPLTSDGHSGDPTWSPDGSTIVYVDSPTGDVHDRQLFAIAPDGTGRRQLTANGGSIEAPEFSPDGSLVAYTLFPHADGSACELIVMGADGQDARPIATKDSLGGCPIDLAWQAIPLGEPTSPSPVPSATPAETPTPQGGTDIGLGFRVCDVTSVAGEFAPGVDGTAFVATKMSDLGRCPSSVTGHALQIVAVDVTGDGMADAHFGPLECDPFCTAFAAPDVDLDGTDELLVENIQFTIAGLRLYEVRADPPDVFPVTVSTPGYPEGGLAPGLEPQLWIGGDAFDMDTLRCATSPDGRVLIQTSAVAVPGDTPDSVWQAAETVFALNADGTIAVVSSRTFQEPVEPGPPSFRASGDGLCGARLPYPYGEG
jgi:hypothetical protein